MIWKSEAINIPATSEFEAIMPTIGVADTHTGKLSFTHNSSIELVCNQASYPIRTLRATDMLFNWYHATAFSQAINHNPFIKEMVSKGTHLLILGLCRCLISDKKLAGLTSEGTYPS